MRIHRDDHQPRCPLHKPTRGAIKYNHSILGGCFMLDRFFLITSSIWVTNLARRTLIHDVGKIAPITGVSENDACAHSQSHPPLIPLVAVCIADIDEVHDFFPTRRAFDFQQNISHKYPSAKPKLALQYNVDGRWHRRSTMNLIEGLGGNNIYRPT